MVFLVEKIKQANVMTPRGILGNGHQQSLQAGYMGNKGTVCIGPASSLELHRCSVQIAAN